MGGITDYPGKSPFGEGLVVSDSQAAEMLRDWLLSLAARAKIDAENSRQKAREHAEEAGRIDAYGLVMQRAAERVKTDG